MIRLDGHIGLFTVTGFEQENEEGFFEILDRLTKSKGVDKIIC